MKKNLDEYILWVDIELNLYLLWQAYAWSYLKTKSWVLFFPWVVIIPYRKWNRAWCDVSSGNTPNFPPLQLKFPSRCFQRRKWRLNCQFNLESDRSSKRVFLTSSCVDASDVKTRSHTKTCKIAPCSWTVTAVHLLVCARRFCIFAICPDLSFSYWYSNKYRFLFCHLLSNERNYQ